MKVFLPFILSLLLLSEMASGKDRGRGDSLRKRLEHVTEKEEEARTLNHLAKHYIYKLPDSSLHFASKVLDMPDDRVSLKERSRAHHLAGHAHFVMGDKQACKTHWERALSLRKERVRKVKGEKAMRKAKKNVGASYGNLGVLYQRMGKLEKAVRFHEKSLGVERELGNSKGMASTYNNLGMVHGDRGLYDEALEYYFDALRIQDSIGGLKNMASTYNNIGVIQEKQDRYEEALKHYQKSLKLRKKADNKQGMGTAYANMGLVHEKLGHPEKALAFYRKGLTISREVGDRKGTASRLNSIGFWYQKRAEEADEDGGLDELDSAISYQKRALQLQKEIGDPEGMIKSRIGLGKAYFDKGASHKALSFFQEAAALAKKIGLKEKLYEAYKGSSKAYEALGSHRKALRSYRRYSRLKDSIHNEESQKRIASMEAKYENEQHKRRIQVLEKEREKQAALAQQREKRNRIIYISAGAGIALIGIFALILYKRLRVTRTQNRIIQEQKEVVEEKQRELDDSMAYAQKIQQALLGSRRALASTDLEHFILFKPKTAVSGDLYWSWKEEDGIYIAAVDCTGHGVPGAFMSMLAVSFLNDIMANSENPSPGEILTRLRERVISELSGTDDAEGSRDGMDAALVKIPNPPARSNDRSIKKSQIPKPKEGVEVEFAGAQNPIYVVREGIADGHSLVRNDHDRSVQDRVKPFKGSSDAIEIKGDPMPVGYHEYAKDAFTTVRLQLQKGDMCYIFSDGYADQFGGPVGKKFRYRPFKDLLLSIHQRPLEQQKPVLDRTFEDWKNESQQEQIDDVLVMGVRL